MSDKKRIVVGISGATGPQYGIRTLEALGAAGVETHLVLSKASRRNIVLESAFPSTLLIDKIRLAVVNHYIS